MGGPEAPAWAMSSGHCLMLELQRSGAHNVNLVTPTHFTPLVRQALVLARANGLSVPVVWNSSAYEMVDTLRTLEGLVDIFLPDLRYMDSQAAARYSAAPDYPEVACAAIKEMHRQVGQLVVEDGPEGQLARRGLLIRLLVLPGNAGRVDLALDWIAENLGTGTAISPWASTTRAPARGIQAEPQPEAHRVPGAAMGTSGSRTALCSRWGQARPSPPTFWGSS
jgi:putative pyruvate formate lyase activating enzyme